jgi:hypothetical protein
MTERRRRLRSRFSLPVELLSELEKEAARRGVSEEVLRDHLLAEYLPIVLAEASRAYLDDQRPPNLNEGTRVGSSRK